MMHFEPVPVCCTIVFQFEVKARYPKVWNNHQDWNLDINADKASVHLIFQHKAFFVGKYPVRESGPWS